jgi:hypothetical protein
MARLDQENLRVEQASEKRRRARNLAIPSPFLGEEYGT